MKIYIAAVKVLRKDMMKLGLPPKLVEKLDWVPVILSCKIFRRLMPYYAETGHSGPPNRLTLPITLVYHKLSSK
jgi:hypothetical protein